jgi:Rieske 2Fe-2S family protein
VGITASESSWSTFQIIPLAPDQTKVIVRTKLEPMTEWSYYRQKKKSDANWYKLMKGKAKYENMEQDDPMASGDIMTEDIYACEQLQKSLKNALFEVGALAQNQESTIVKFQEVVAKWLTLACNEE